MLNDYKRINDIQIVDETDKAYLIEGAINTEEIGRVWCPKTQCQYTPGDSFIRIKTWMYDKFVVDYSYKTIRHEEWDGGGYKVARVAYGLDLHALTPMTPQERIATVPSNTKTYNFRYATGKKVLPGDIVACLSVSDLKNALVTEVIPPTEANREEYNKATAWIIDTINTSNYIAENKADLIRLYL